MCLFGDVIYRGLKYGLYDGLEPIVLDVIGADKTALIFFANWVLGSVIAAAVGTFLMPLDTVRRLMIMDTNSQERACFSALCKLSITLYKSCKATKISKCISLYCSFA